MMQVSKLNEGLQLAASIGVIVGLLLVAYEVRQSNLYAAAEAQRSNFSGWEEISISDYETDIADAYVKSLEDPGNLSMAELFKLSGWLTAVMNQYERALMMSDMGLGADQMEDLTRNASTFFGNPFGRVWLEVNKGWIDPRNIAAAERGLTSKSEDARSNYYERLESGLEELDK